MALSEQANQRNEVRQSLLQKLEAAVCTDVLFDIALHESNLDLALQLWPQLKERQKHERRAKLAFAAEKSHPAVAIEQWTQLARLYIEQRQRGAYHEAAKILKRVHDVYKNQNNLDEWHDFIAALRTEHKTLRALDDELKKAGL